MSDLAWRIGGLILWPIVFVVGLLFIALIALWAFLAKAVRGSSSEAKGKVVLAVEAEAETWSEFMGAPGLQLFSKHMGEVRFGPGYIALRSEPSIAGLDDKLFGEWTFRTPNTIFLQQWNSTSAPDTDLIIVHPDHGTIETVLRSIPSVLWKMRQVEEGQYELTCDTGKEVLKYFIASES